MAISTGCIKMIGPVSICHYSFENARISKFPTLNETAGVQVLCACAIPLPSSLSVCDVTKRLWRLWSRNRFVCCNLRSMNRLFLCRGHSDDNLTVIPPSPNSIRRWYQQFQTTGRLCKGKSTGRPHVSEESVERVRHSFFNPLWLLPLVLCEGQSVCATTTCEHT